MTSEEILFFDRIAENWDENEGLSTPEKVAEILSIVGIREGQKVLDLGTGTGVLLPMLSRLVGEQGRVTAVDISEGMLSRAKKKFDNLKNVEFKKLDFEEESIDGEYDIILLYCVYPHLHTPRQTLLRLSQNNLTPSGRIIIAFPTDESFINNIHKEKKAESEMLPPARKLSSLFSEWGLNSRVVRYDSGHYIIEVTGNLR